MTTEQRQGKKPHKDHLYFYSVKPNSSTLGQTWIQSSRVDVTHGSLSKLFHSFLQMLV